MKSVLIPIIIVCCSLSGFSQKEKAVYSKVKIKLNEFYSIKKLSGLGVETDHGDYKSGSYFISAFSESELGRIKNAGFETQVLIADVAKDFEERNARLSPSQIQENLFADFCDKVKSYKIPKNWKYGNMGGHLTYGEMLLHLDSMKILYPNLISTKREIDTIRSVEGRTIWQVKISDNPEVSDPTEPQALYSAIHHAREPVGMHQLIFFMWYLLENYESDPDIRLLVDNSELYFVPCLNPDGYIFNETNFPNGGGMWRKNRRDNGNGTFGVDLNRNYGYNWGFDDFGSSPDPEWETYRGTSPFSEPETRAMKAFCESHNFKIALNYHTYSNLVIHPWGYDNIQCEDSTLFRNLTKEMTRENNYRIGTGMEVLNYNSNGSSDDFMYSTQPEKPKIMAMTPEVGDWFWPTQNEILGLCVENLHQNLTVARSLHPMVRLVDSTGLFLKAGISPNTGPYRLRYKIQRIGVNQSQANFTVEFKPISSSNSVGLATLSKTYTNLANQEAITDSIEINPNGTLIAEQVSIDWQVKVSNGIFAFYDTITHFGGDPFSNASYFENCDNTTNWTGNWVRVNSGQQEGSGFLKPTAGDYNPEMNSTFTRRRPFDLRPSTIKAAELSLWTKYAIEKNFDYASLAVSTDSGTVWTNVCTDKSALSSPFSQQAGEDIIPIWDGFQRYWQKEYLNLTPYIGQKVWIRFLFHSDEFQEYEGFGVDNIRVTIHNNTTSNQILDEKKATLFLVPNPSVSGKTLIIGGLSESEEATITIYDVIGSKVFSSELFRNAISVPELPNGCYQVLIETKSGRKEIKKWMVLR